MEDVEFFYDRNQPKKNVQSYGRLAVQQRMRLAMAFLHPLRPIVAESWLTQGKGNRSKAFGQALKALMQEAMEGHYPDQRIAAERVRISTGLLPAVQIEDVVCDGQTLEVYFSGESSPLSNGTDEVVLVVYSPEVGVAGKNTDVSLRNEGHIRLKLPPPLRKDSFHVYLFLHNARKRLFSRSVYIGRLGGQPGKTTNSADGEQ